MSVEVESVGIEEAIAHFQQIPAEVRLALEAQVHMEALHLVEVIKDEYLSGQVLGIRSGRLRRSVHELELHAGGDSVEAAVGVNLGDAGYAGFWEYGFTGTEDVREHLREITQAFGRPISPREVVVRQHTRQVDQAPRSYLRAALAAEAAGIIERIKAAALRAAGGEN